MTRMEYEIEIEDATGFVVVRTRGVPDIAGFMAYANDLHQRLLGWDYARILSDHRALSGDFSAITSADIQSYARHLVEFKDALARRRIASVCGSKLHFGLTRMWESLMENSGLTMDHRVFTDIDEARRWLASEHE